MVRNEDGNKTGHVWGVERAYIIRSGLRVGHVKYVRFVLEADQMKFARR